MMFINARPRIVSNGFETFVPTHRTEALHQRLVEMTNNDVNAWSVFRPVAPPVSDIWDQNLDDFDSNENYPYHTVYSGYCQESSSSRQNQAINYQKTPSYSTVAQTQYQLQNRAPVPQEVHQQPMQNMTYFQDQSPMLGNDYSQWSLGRRNGSFAEFSNTRNALNGSTYQGSTESDLAPYTSSLCLTHSGSSYHEDGSAMDTLGKTSPSTVYSTSSTTTAHIDPMSMVCPSVPNAPTKIPRWVESFQSDTIQYQPSFKIPVYDGLLRAPIQQGSQLYDGLWNSGGGTASSWTSQEPPADSGTISPKVLTLNVTAAPSSSSGSSQGAMLSMSDAGSGISSVEDHSDISGPESLSVVEPPEPPRRQRQILPDSIPSSRRNVSFLPNSNCATSNSSKKRPLKANSDTHRRTRASTPYIGPTTSETAPRAAEPTSHNHLMQKRIEPKPAVPPPRQACTESPQPAATVEAMHHRDSKDDFLVRSKLAGMSYKKIREQGGFTEAESTLRGRFRTLTKHKTARVRKPEWEDNDIRLLKKAVRKLGSSSDIAKGRVPWKLVAEYIADNGGSYHFGNATCRKKWDEIYSDSGA